MSAAATAFPLLPDDKRKSFAGARPAVREALRTSLPMKVYAQLMQSGWPREWAEELVRLVEMNDNPSGKLYGEADHRLAAQAQVQMITGGVLFLAGVVITLFSTLTALMSPRGGTMVFAWGAVISGALIFTRAFKLSRRYPHRPLPGRGILEDSGTVQPNRNPNDPY